jgi:hypothetical protein
LLGISAIAITWAGIALHFQELRREPIFNDLPLRFRITKTGHPHDRNVIYF